MKDLLAPEVQHFIRDHEYEDERALVLKNKTIFGVPSALIAAQISGRRKAKEKLPSYYNTQGIVYPPGLNLEQSSSEQTARFKASIVSKLNLSPVSKIETQPFALGVDLTGGFGIDTFFLSKVFERLDTLEPNENLLEIARHNHHLLDATNIRYHNTKAEFFLDQPGYAADLVFIDPSRRNETKKVFTLSDSEPNIVSLQEKIFQRTKRLLIKASPLLDIKLGLKELSFVKKVFAVSVENEMKELLFYCERSFSEEAEIEAVNLSKQEKPESFSFLFSEEGRQQIEFADPHIYVYEPNASILKAGAFKSLAHRFLIPKLQASTHLYTSETFIADFPGRIFKVISRVKPDAKDLRQFFPEGRANITTRNYPLSVEELKKKTALKDGGEKFLIGCSGVKEKFLLAAERIR